jgi:cytoskeletal protein RodZ
MKNENDTSSSEELEKIVPDLRGIRESKGIALVDISRATRVRVAFLEAIENEDFRLLPEPVYARIFIKIYAQALGVESEIILSRYEKYLEEQKAAWGEKTTRKRYRPELGKFFGWVLAVLFVAILLLFLLYPGHNSGSGEKIKKDAAGNIESKTEIVENTTEPTSDRPATERVVETEDRTYLDQKIADTETTYKLTIEATDRTWLKIAVDDDPPYEILLKPGEKIYREASEKFIIDIGNAGGVNILFQGKSLGVLGKRGDVIHLTLPEE